MRCLCAPSPLPRAVASTLVGLLICSYDPESWDEGPDTGEPSPSAPGAFRIGSDGVVSPAPPTFWGLTRARARHHEVGAPDASEQLRLLPAAVFVWLDQFEPFYAAFARDMEAVRPAPAGAFGWELDAVLSKEVEMVVWEGFAVERGADEEESVGDPSAAITLPARSTTMPDAAAELRRAKLNHNPEWQAKLNSLAAEDVAAGKRMRCKKALAIELTQQLKLNPKTVERRTRRPRETSAQTPRVG